MPKHIVVKKLKRTELLSELLVLMKEYGFDTKNTVSDLKNKGYTELVVDDMVAEDFVAKISQLAEVEVVKREKLIDGYGALSILTLDLFLVVFIVETMADLTKIRDTVLAVSSNLQFTALFVIVLKILTAFIIIKGFVNNFSTTFFGGMLKVKNTGEPKKLAFTMMLPVVGFYMLKSGYGKIFEIIGLFFIIFFVFSVLLAYNLFDIKFIKFEDGELK